MKKKTLIIISFVFLLSCGKEDNEGQKLYVELRKEQEFYKKAQNRIDTNLKSTEDHLLRVRDSVQRELGYFSVQYHQFNEDLNKYIQNLEDKAITHRDLLYEQAVLEDNLINEKMEYSEAIERKKALDKMREDIEKNFQISLSFQDTLLVKASRLINKQS